MRSASNALNLTHMFRNGELEMKCLFRALLLCSFLIGRAFASQELLTIMVPGAPSYCDVTGIVARNANEALDGVDVTVKKQLEKYSFASFDPLYRFDIDDSLIVNSLTKIREDLDKCEADEDSGVLGVYRSLFRSEDWGQRALVLAMAQQSRHDRLNLVELYVGYLISLLNEGVVPPPPPKSCGAGYGYSPAAYFPSGVKEWFRIRVVSWVECKTGDLIVYMPELGWMKPSQDQIKAIRKSSPSCCKSLRAE